MRKFLSRKFIVFILNYITIVFLSLNRVIDSVSCVVALIVNALIYTSIEGVIDLKNITYLKMNNFEVRKEETKGDEDV